MHMSGKVKELQVAKPEITQYYNKIKSGVDTYIRKYAEYYVHYGIYYTMIYVTDLASYIIYRAHNPPLNSKILTDEVFERSCQRAYTFNRSS